MPVIELARHLGDVPVGGCSRSWPTTPRRASTSPAWCRMRGQEYVGEDAADDGAPRYRVRRVSLTRLAQGRSGAQVRRDVGRGLVAVRLRAAAAGTRWRDSVYSWVPTCSTT